MKEVQKIVLDYQELAQKCEAHKTLGEKVICTIGSWDMLHIGHLRYLNKAREHGDVLVVGADSDRGIKTYKNPMRPIIPEGERMEMLSYQSCIDYVTRVDDIDGKGIWHMELVKVVRPDAFVCVDSSYSDEQVRQLKELCAEVYVLPRQAKNTSTSRIIEQVAKKQLEKMLSEMKV